MVFTQSLKAFYRIILMAFLWNNACEAKETGIFHPQTFTLENGLQVIVITNPRAPVITQMLYYKVGSIDDPIGKSGLAHFLEHLMFKGTSQVPAGDFMEAITKIGGEQNAVTTFDYTYYYQNVSADHLELIIKLEADRMTNLALLPNLVENERKVILEERRLRTDNKPASILSEAVNKAFYWHHPYGRPPIGWEHEMKTLTQEDAKAFYKSWYAPNNAILIFAGDVTVAQLKPLVEKYYGKIPRSELPLRSHVQEPIHRDVAERLSLFSPLVDYFSWERHYPAPNFQTKNQVYPYALEVLSYILSNGATSIFYRKLVEGQKILASINVNYSASNLGPAMFSISAQPSESHTLEEVETAIEQEIEILIKNGISKEEVEQAKSRKLARLAYLKDDVLSGAQEFGAALAIGRPINDIELWPDRIKAVTVEDVNAVLKLVFEAKDHVTGLLMPEKVSAISLQNRGVETQ
ncbi:MAG: insulinase family protein [Alphaproteobacteria bacterium]|nr:insulinase family protein [Alphaproteobacteria bacterium]